jgi:hypothetical protein
VAAVQVTLAVSMQRHQVQAAISSATWLGRGVGTVSSTGSDMTLAVLSETDRSRDSAQEGLR